MGYKYTENDAKREVEELIQEGYGFSAIRVFLHDLARSKDITWEEATQIQASLINRIDCSIATI